MAFVHLHVHSEYSMLDGACRIADLPAAAATAGQTALALTDHGNMFGAVSFYKACQKAGVKPIIGCEVYVAPRSRFDRDPLEKYHHLILLCRNDTGYRNLSKLVSAGYTEGLYAKPRVDDELLMKYADGLIALSGCIAGRIPQALLREDHEGAREEALKYRSFFGEDNFYLEVQNHRLPEEDAVRSGLIRLSRETGIPLAATNDAHYIRREEADVQTLLTCIQTGRTLEEGSPIRFPNDEFYLKSEEEMRLLFADCPDAVDNTAVIAGRCAFDFDFQTRHLPTYPLPEGTTSEKYLRELAENGLKDKMEKGLLDTAGHTFEDYKFRMIYEMMMIAKMGYCDYYLIVWDFVNAAKNMGITVGPGRGSGAGSLVAYLIGITEVDSIAYGLLFERFLNPERVSMPDFDIDFCDTRRDEVISYVAGKYGRDHVSQIAAFGTLGAKAALHDVGRALGIPSKDVDAVSKLIPSGPDQTLKKALNRTELKALYDGSLTVRQLIDTAMSVEGMPRNITTHAAGVVITERPVEDYMPLTVSSGAVLTQYDMNTVAELGLLKFDFLAIRYLTVIENAEKLVRSAEPSFDVKKLPLNDGETMDMICAGETGGVFQLESAGMRRLMTQLKPRTIEDLMIAIAVFRPGPMDSIPALLEARRGKKPTYGIAQLKEILDDTSGCIIYQEQVMQIFRKIAGYSFGRADIVRRAMAKKHADELENERDAFLAGAEKNLIGREAANALFDSMASFASYAFNKSHAAAYAIVAYRTAYLKAHYPREYLSALLTSVSGDTAKTAEYVASLERHGFKLLPPDVNESSASFTPVPGGVRFGLYGVKNVGYAFVEALILERRENGKYLSLEDFVRRLKNKGGGKPQTAALIGAGAFDRLGEFRSRMLEGLDGLFAFIGDEQRLENERQIDLFTAAGEENTARVGFSYPEIDEYPTERLLESEKELTGMWFSGHPLADYRKNIEALNPQKIRDFVTDERDELLLQKTDRVRFCGMIRGVSVKTSKKGNRFAILTLEDDSGSIECLLFGKVLNDTESFLVQGSAVCVAGTLTDLDKDVPKVSANDLLPLIKNAEYERIMPQKSGLSSSAPEAKPQTGGAVVKQKPEEGVFSVKKLYIRLTNDEKTDRRIAAVIGIFPGSVPCIYYHPDTGAYENTGKGVALTPRLLSMMKTIMGEENVVAK